MLHTEDKKLEKLEEYNTRLAGLIFRPPVIYNLLQLSGAIKL